MSAVKGNNSIMFSDKSTIRPGWHDKVLFGLHYDLHANANDIELGAGLTHEHLKAELEKVRPDWVQCDCKGHPGYTSWPTEIGSTSPGVVKDSLRIYRDVTREFGIPLVMHYSGVIDNRAVELHPEWRYTSRDGVINSEEWRETGATCSLSAYTDQLMIPQMLEIVQKYDVDGFWIDGDCWGAKFCYCEKCKEAFKHKTGIKQPPMQSSDPHWLDWAAFHRKIFEDHVARYAEAIHAFKPTCTVCSNWMYSICHPSIVDVPVDYISGDLPYYWVSSNAVLESRFIASRGMSWDLMAWGFMSMEKEMAGWIFKSSAQLCQEAALVISQGGGISIYDLPNRNGSLISWHQDIMAEVADFVRARKEWVQNSRSIPQVALLHSAAHYYGANGEFLMEMWSPTRQPISGALDCLLEDHYHVDVLNESDLIESIFSYPLVVIAEQTNPSQDLLDVLSNYVEAGGKLLISGVNTSSDYGILSGTEADGDPENGHFYLEIDAQTTTIKGPWQPVKLKGATSLLSVLTSVDPAKGQSDAPAITINRIGKGMVICIHNQYFTHYSQTHYPRSRKLVRSLIETLLPDFIVDIEAPAKLQIVLRRQGTSVIVHMINTGSGHPLSPTQGMIEEVDPIDNVRLTIQCPSRPSRVYLAPSFEGLSWEWDDGLLNVRVRSVGIMDSVVIES